MMRTEDDMARERLRAWISSGHDGPTQGKRQKASEVAERLLHEVPSVADCEYVLLQFVEEYNRGYGIGIVTREWQPNETAKAALLKAERALDPCHSRTCAAVMLMIQKTGVSPVDRGVIDRTCDCQVTTDDALTAVREALRGFEARW